MENLDKYSEILLSKDYKNVELGLSMIYHSKAIDNFCLNELLVLHNFINRVDKYINNSNFETLEGDIVIKLISYSDNEIKEAKYGRTAETYQWWKWR